jgi:hypothetical protein
MEVTASGVMSDGSISGVSLLAEGRLVVGKGCASAIALNPTLNNSTAAMDKKSCLMGNPEVIKKLRVKDAL